MPVHFNHEEFSRRQSRAIQALKDADLDGILLFAPESHFYLCGYDTFGFAMFQCMVLGADGSLALLTRLPDLRQAQQTSILTDQQIHVWPEIEGANPAVHLLSLLSDMKLTSGRLGIETQTAGLTAFNGDLIKTTFGTQVTLIESSDLIRHLRRDKSPQEIEYHRRAAALSDDALDAALAASGPGAFEGDILAAMQGAVFAGGGGYAGNEFVIGSAEQALLCRYHCAPRTLDAVDQLTLEWSGAYFRYQAAMMRTLVIGKASDKQRTMHTAATEALVACEQAIIPGRPMGDVYDAHRRVFDSHGLQHARLQACGYGMGAVFNPIWVDFPMFYEGNPLIMNAGNVYFLHMILMDSDAGHAMCWGHSVLVTDTGVERLSRSPLDLLELE
ncbi:MAG: Xaa-Pro peptidase family protein [Pseudomonadota bacterium]